jgi:hypothetical protein
VKDVFEALHTFANGTPQPDDITLLVFEAEALRAEPQDAPRLEEIVPIVVTDTSGLSLESIHSVN